MVDLPPFSAGGEPEGGAETQQSFLSFLTFRTSVPDPAVLCHFFPFFRGAHGMQVSGQRSMHRRDMSLSRVRARLHLPAALVPQAR